MVGSLESPSLKWFGKISYSLDVMVHNLNHHALSLHDDHLSIIDFSLSCPFLSSGYEKRVVGEGMPLVDDNNQHGDLVIKFTVVFPPVLNQQQKALIRQALAL